VSGRGTPGPDERGEQAEEGGDGAPPEADDTGEARVADQERKDSGTRKAEARTYDNAEGIVDGSNSSDRYRSTGRAR
jgi:hypothetical protein